MRKILAWGLILCLSFSLYNIATAYDVVGCTTETQMRTFYETHKNDENVQKHFVWPSELEFLGTFEGFSVNVNGSRTLWTYKMNFFYDVGSAEEVYFKIYFYDADWEEFASNVSKEDIEFKRLDISKTSGNMIRLSSDALTGTGQWYIIKRGKLEYIYRGSLLDSIVWKHSGMSFKLEPADAIHYDLGDSVLSDLLSLEEAPFLEAERLLYNISNLNPEPEKACGGVHVYGTQWDFDDNTHWYPCICGAKSQQGFHGDENQDGACDVCAYDPNGENVSDPVEDPVQPTQPPTEPATQPTEPTQPTTGAPTAPPTQPNPAEPDAPSVGLWIGISAAVLAAAAALLLLRKKK